MYCLAASRKKKKAVYSGIRFLLWSSIFLFACSDQKETKKTEETEIALRWELIENGYKGKDNFRSTLTLTNKGTQTLPSQGWALYFNHTFCREILTDSLPASVRIVHINGDFYKMIPGASFEPLGPGKTFSMTILSTYAATKYSDAPGGFYFVFNDSSSGKETIKEVKDYTIAPFIEDKQLLRNGNDHMPLSSAAFIFEQNNKVKLSEEDETSLIVPSPRHLKRLPDSLALNAGLEIRFDKKTGNEAMLLQSWIKGQIGIEIKAIEISGHKNPSGILLQLAPLAFSSHREAYQLRIDRKDGIVITANTPSGIFYGVQSLRALLPLKKEAKKTFYLPCLAISDFPEFEYRGMLLDVARNFQPKEKILHLIDLLSFYKLNTLSLQIADDEGWRLEIPGLPELTELGSKRGHTITEEDRLLPSYGSGAYGTEASNGYYTKEEYIALLRYAKERHVQIIPQIDLPGHARAAIKAMDLRYRRYTEKGNYQEASRYLLRDRKDSSKYLSVQKFNDNVICPCQEGVYQFIGRVAGALKAMHAEAGAPLTTFNIGGDEVPEGVWKKSPACENFMKGHSFKEIKELKHYFFTRAFKTLQQHDLVTAAYEDVLSEYLKEKSVRAREEFDTNKLVLFSWNNVWGWGNEEASYRLANAGVPVVLGHVTNLYLDLAYTNAPQDPGQYWGGYNDTRKMFEYTPYCIYNSAYYDVDGNPLPAGFGKGKQLLTANGKKSVKGLQAFLFSETLKNSSMLDYFVFPKLLGMAERAWSQPPAWAGEEDKIKRLALLEKDWNRFACTLGKRELPRLDGWSTFVHYYLPAPGAKVEAGMLYANAAFPGLTIRYTTDGSEPDEGSTLYTGPVKVSGGKIRLACFGGNGRKSIVTTLSY